MKLELKRAILRKSNLGIILFVIIMMFINAYYGGWYNAIKAPQAEDLYLEKDVMELMMYYGNTLKVWRDGTFIIPVISPILLLVPYALSFSIEKDNSFRFLMISREGRKKYLFNKVFAIILSGVFIILIGELIFYIITWFLTINFVDGQYLEYITVLYPGKFVENPYLYFFIHIILKYTIYLATALFGVGIMSFFSNKAGIISAPFIILVIGALTLPKPFVYDIALNNIFAIDYQLNTIWIYLFLLSSIGVTCLYLSERRLYSHG